MTDKYRASIAGIDFEAQDISDAIASSIVQHEFPDQDGALLEHMGQKARSVRIRAFFINDDYDRHQDLIDLLAVKDSYELVHPKYGVLVGFAAEVSVRHDDRDRCAEIDITFVEDLIGSTETTLADVPDVEFVSQETFLSGLALQLKLLSQDIAADMQKIQNAIALRSYTSQLSSCVASIEAMLTTVTNPADSILATVQFATDTPGTLLGSLAHVVERYSLMYDSLKSAPSRFVASFRNGMLQLRSAFGSGDTAAHRLAIATVIKHATISGSLQLGLDLAACYKADEQTRQDQKRLENSRSFDVSGNYLSPVTPDQFMTINEIEQSLADCNSEIQLAVNQARDMRELQSLAEALILHVDKIKINREKIVPITIENEMPLHLICLKRGLPYQAAERVSAINRFKNPSFITGDMQIYVG